jgi:hypothetical protein
MRSPLNGRTAVALGLLAAGLWALWAVAGADRRSPGPDPSEAQLAAAPPRGPAELGRGPADAALALPEASAPALPASVDLPRAPTRVASLAGALPPEAALQVKTIQAWGAEGPLAAELSGPGGRFLLEVPRQELSGELELRFEDGWSAWLGPFELGAGCRHEVSLAGLPTRLAPRSGRLEPPGPTELELEERHGSLWLTQRVAVDGDGAFRFLAARSGPFWARAEGGQRFLAAGRPGLAAEDPPPFRPPPIEEYGSPQPALRQRAWEWPEPATAPATGEPAEPGSATVGLHLVDGRGRGLAGVTVELELETRLRSAADPARPALPVVLEFQALSKEQGRCEFRGLPGGRARLAAPQDAPWLSLEPRDFELADGQALELGPIALAGLSNVTGTCQDAFGRPLLGARLRFIQPALAQAIEAASDEQGRFRFERLPAGAGELLLLPPAGFPGLGRPRRLALEAPADGTVELEISLAP